MSGSIGDIFLCAAIACAILFMLVLGYVSIEESVLARRTNRH